MRISIVSGDITKRPVEAIVNAANSSLLGGGGVDGAIHRAAGPRLLAATRELRTTSLPDGLPPGQAVATPGFDLPARWVIHTVGPNRHIGQDDPGVLESCFRSAMETAVRIGAKSVAFSAIGAGVYGWSAREVANAARLGVLGTTAAAGPRSDETCRTWPGVDLIEFVAFTDAIRTAFETEFSDVISS